MKLLSRDDILGAQDLPSEDVDVPEWGGCVRVRGLTGAERDAFEAEIVQMRGRDTHVNLRNVRAKLVARSIVDEDGKRIFGDADVHALGKKSAVALQRVFEVAQRLSGLTGEDMEELAKNSESAPPADLPSD